MRVPKQKARRSKEHKWEKVLPKVMQVQSKYFEYAPVLSSPSKQNKEEKIEPK
jgi:hypothetical protein